MSFEAALSFSRTHLSNQGTTAREAEAAAPPLRIDGLLGLCELRTIEEN
jgi:hypothetical protein